MACFRPISAWQPLAKRKQEKLPDGSLGRYVDPEDDLDPGPIFFSAKDNCREIQVPCGSCIGCRISKRDAWAVRCTLEAQMHPASCFITLTYDPSHEKLYGPSATYSLQYRDWQLFAKRLRDRIGSFRFFVAGEYGSEGGRAHWHALIFGTDFSADRFKDNSIYAKSDVFKSKTLGKCWPFGYHSIQGMGIESAKYCAKYICDRRPVDDPFYTGVDPVTGEVVGMPRRREFARMSLRPGLGYAWLEKYYKEVYESGNYGIAIAGRPNLCSVPRYFHKVVDRIVAGDAADWFDYQRYLRADKFLKPVDNTYARLAVREEVAHARERFNNERANGVRR